jgi:hypothetical protein
MTGAMRTAIVYVLSADRHRQLAYSVATLLRSGTRFDRVVAFCIGADPGWTFADPRVEVRAAPPLYDDYFYGNKLHACDVDAERVVFLDTDTLVFSPMDRVWSGEPADVIARVAIAYDGPQWDRAAWKEACDRFGGREIPMYNAGFVVFQNDAHRRLRDDWKRAIDAYRAGELRPPFDPRMSDQYGLALAIANGRLAVAEMGRSEHTFGWMDPHIDRRTVVFHTAHPMFDWYVKQLRIPAPPGVDPA